MISMGIPHLIFRSGFENPYFKFTFQLEIWSIYMMENESHSVFSCRPPRHWWEQPSIFFPSLHPLHSPSLFTDTLFQHKLHVFSIFPIFLFLLLAVFINRWAHIFIEHACIKNNIKKHFKLICKSESMPEIRLPMQPQLIYLGHMYFDTGFNYMITNFFPQHPSHFSAQIRWCLLNEQLFNICFIVQYMVPLFNGWPHAIFVARYSNPSLKTFINFPMSFLLWCSPV